MLSRIIRLEQKAPRDAIDLQRFAGIVVNDLPAIRAAAAAVGSEESAEYQRIAEKMIEWIEKHGTDFVNQGDDLVIRCSGVDRDHQYFDDCKSYVLTIAGRVAGMIFPDEAWGVI